jgi:UDP-N-acetylglucosamine transferase subunit ALG13
VIFVTIGSMFPFDRLIRAMDAWAASQLESGQPAGGQPGEGEGVLAQIGDGGYRPRHMRWVRSLEREEYARTVAAAELVVAHAGMGSVITAGEHGKPIVLLPRRAAAGEHTNDHQVDTARWLRTRPGIYLADAEADLPDAIAAARAGGAGAALGTVAPAAFLARIRAFAETGRDRGA